MDKAENGPAIVLAQQTVVINQPGAKLGDLFGKGIAPASVALEMRFIVVDMHFDIAYAKTHHLRNAFEQVVPVVFLGVEEAVLRTPARGVPGSIVGNARPLVAPPGHAIERRGDRSGKSQRLVMIGDGNPGALRFCVPNGLPQTIFQVRR
jgi:hypothetical protein